MEEEINGIPVVFIATEEADVEEKRGRSIFFFFFFKSNDPACGLDHGRDSGAP